MTDDPTEGTPQRALRPAVPQAPRPPTFAKKPPKHKRKPQGRPRTRIGHGTHLARPGLIGIIKPKD